VSQRCLEVLEVLDATRVFLIEAEGKLLLNLRLLHEFEEFELLKVLLEVGLKEHPHS
jgi:hypothetical protein